MSLGDFRDRRKANPQLQPLTVVDFVEDSAAAVVWAYADRSCNCSECTSRAMLSLHNLFLAVAIRHSLYGATDADVDACVEELHRAAERILAIEHFVSTSGIEGRMH